MTRLFYPNLCSIVATSLLTFLCQDVGIASKGVLTPRSNCICPGYTLTIAECTVEGGPGDAMIWRGSAFDCSTKNNEINLNFGRFSSAAGVCNNGSIQARSIMGVEYNLYTSQLNITVSSDMIGKTIECVHDNINNSTVSVVGTLTLATVGPLPPPTILFISEADFITKQVTFNWNQADTKCPGLDIQYKILASNCGSCSTTTNHTTVTCTNVKGNGSMCTFAIQTVVCKNITGNESYQISLNLLPFTPSETHGIKHDSLSVLITGIVLLLAAMTFVVGFLLISKFRKKNSGFEYTTRKIHNLSQMEDVYSPPVKIVDNNTYGIEDNTVDENPKPTANIMMGLGDPPNLNSLLHLLQGKINSKWFQFGLALGVPKKVLYQLTDYSEKDSLVEVLDYWLTHHPNQPTWQEVSDAQSKVY